MNAGEGCLLAFFSFNRTRLELKFNAQQQQRLVTVTFNRTRLELK